MFVRPEKLASGCTSDDVLTVLLEERVPGLRGSCSEVYLEKAFKNSGFVPTECLPVAQKLGENSLKFLGQSRARTEALRHDDE